MGIDLNRGVEMSFAQRCWGSVGGVLCAVAGALLAGSARAAEENAVETITVTAQKQEQDLQTVPISVKVITDQTLSEINADGLKDIVRLVPSLSMTDLSRGGNNVQIRGLGSNVASVGTVALYNDGVIAANRIGSSGTFSEQDSGLYDVNRVEVLRGPQGTLWGEGSFGGVINVISNMPNTQQYQASLSTSAFEVNSGSSDNHDAAGMINVPIVKDVLAFRAVAFDYDHQGYIDAVNVLPLLSGAAPELVQKDANTEKVTGGRALLGFTPNETFDGTLIYKHQKTELGIQNYDSPDLIQLVNSLAGTSFRHDSQAIFSPNFGSEDKTDEGILNLDLTTGIGTFTSVTGYGKVQQENAATLDAESKAWSEELRLASDNSGAFSWIAGAYYRTVERDIDAFSASFAKDKADQWAVFGQTYWTFAPKWTATLGLRYGDYQVELTDQVNHLPSVKNSFNNLSPKIALDWQINDVTLAYVSAAQGFRAGGANIDESLGTDPSYKQGFDDDTIWNYEIGLKAGLWDNMVTINTALFYIDWSDIQIDKAIVSVVNPPVQFIVTNGKDAHSYGIETDIYIYPADGWTLVLGGSWLQAEYDGGTIDSATAGLGIPLNGEKLPNAPEYLVNASVEKTFPISDGMQGFFRTDYTMRANSFADVPNEAPPGGNFESGRYNLFNVRAGIKGDFWALQLFATNLFDQDASSFNFYDGGFGDLHVVLQPRTFGINLKLNYN